jgi:thiamine pyrophosphate-dependent acetolactate synthase large subunit-like protein
VSGPEASAGSDAGEDVAHYVGRVLAELGVAQAFGVIGSGNFAVTNSLRAHGVPFVAARHEAGAITMADGYVRVSGRMALMTTHQGCGLTNAITGIGEAAKSRTPLIVLTADSAGSAVTSNFKIDQDALVRSVGAVPERVHSAASARDDVLRAYRTALADARTVVLNLPLDVQRQLVPPDVAAAPSTLTLPSPARASEDAVTELADLVRAAARPVFVAGRGGRAYRAELLSAAAAAGALVATSAVANGLFRGDPFDLGISGGFSTPLAAELIRGADLVVGWGASLNMWTMRHGALIGASTRVVQVDHDPLALGAHRRLDLAVTGDVGATARDLTAALDGERTGYRTDAVRDRIASEGAWSALPFDDLSGDGRIDPRLLSAELDRMLPAARTVAVDSGNFAGYPSAYIRPPDTAGSCFTQAFQSVGLGLASGIGAAVARPDRVTVVGAGDGGFFMSIAELETAVRLRLPLVLVVYDDSAYGAEVHHFGGSAADLEIVRFPDRDIAAIARGFGATGLTVTSPEDLRGVEEWLTGPRDRPLVIDAKIADDGGAWWLAEAFAGH